MIPHTLVSERGIVGQWSPGEDRFHFPSHGIGPPALEDSARGQDRRAPACSSHISNVQPAGVSTMELLSRWASSQPLQHAQWGVVLHRTLDKFLPLYARVGSAGMERTVHHHTAARGKSAPELAACKRTRRTGDLGLLPLQPHTHGLGGHTHGLGGAACRDRDALRTATSTVARATAGERCQSVGQLANSNGGRGKYDGHSTLPGSLIHKCHAGAGCGC